MRNEGVSQRREQLWSLLGDLPDRRAAITADVVGEELREGYLLRKLVLDLNGIEPVPAYLCLSSSAEGPAPAIVFNHAHGGNYVIGKDEAVSHREPLQEPPWAQAFAAEGYHTLAIDSWNFGERRGRSESALFKEMLWKGQVLWGMMVFDTVRATDWLAGQQNVDAERLGSVGLSMGSTMAWWHAALDERVKVCVDVCCLTDFDWLLKTNGLDYHGIYYYVPSLLKHFDTASINALIAPRAHLALAGNYDKLTPPQGLDVVDEKLRKVYGDAGASGQWRLVRYPCGHMETGAMRREMLQWLVEKL